MNFVVTQKPVRYSFVRNSIFTEDLLWKEILVYLMNTSDETPEINFIRDIEPLDFDPGMILEYLERLASDTKKIGHLEELKELYRQIENPSLRQDAINVIGGGMCFIDEDDLE